MKKTFAKDSISYKCTQRRINKKKMNFGRWLGYEHIRNNNEAENHIIFSKINTKKKKKKKKNIYFAK